MAHKEKAGHSVSQEAMMIRRLCAGLALLALFIVLVAGIIAGVSLSTINFRAIVAVGGVFILGRVLLRVFKTYEEISRG